jgi:hypothetical protein
MILNNILNMMLNQYECSILDSKESSLSLKRLIFKKYIFFAYKLLIHEPLLGLNVDGD